MQSIRKPTYTRSQITCSQWTRQQIALLKEAHARHGNSWGLIASQYFPDRNPNMVRCKYNYIATKEEARERRENARKQPLEVSEMLGILNQMLEEWCFDFDTQYFNTELDGSRFSSGGISYFKVNQLDQIQFWDMINIDNIIQLVNGI